MRKTKFSIFDPVVAYDHREFYEQIVNELNVILPVCNQGKCLSAQIGRNIAEQETIRELMERVERFRGELMEGTKNLFAQFYQSKEVFHNMIQSTVAYVKINLMDRNLLERSCDVRWWALEIAFSECIEMFNNNRINLENLNSVVKEYREQLIKEEKELIRSKTSFFGGNAKKLFRLNLIDQKSTIIKELIVITENIDLLFNLEKFEKLEKICVQVKEKFTKEDKENIIISLLEKITANIKKLRGNIDYANERLETINNSYTLYRDLIICDDAGYVIATSNKKRREKVQGINVATEEWFRKAIETNDGTEYYAQDFAPSAVEEQNSLIYSTAVRTDGKEDGVAIGAMGIFFDFQDEAGIILADYTPKQSDGSVEEGWGSFFSNSEGIIIASSNKDNNEVGARTHIPQSHLNLKAGETKSSYGFFNGEDSALFTAKTDGYLDYKGLGWSSHMIVPRRSIFSRGDTDADPGVKMDILLNSCIIPEINKKIYNNVEHDKRAMQLISTNGMLFAAELGVSGQALSPIFEQITKTGDFATKCMEDLLREMAIDELNLNFQTLRLFSKQAIDLIDRNLFERSADICWWSTDKVLIDALSHPSDDNAKDAVQRLKVINTSYTMYRNLILVDAAGNIIACSSPALLGGIKHINVSGHEWFAKGIITDSESQYAVADVQDSELEPTKSRSLVYSSGVRMTNDNSPDPLGVLGVLFDWDTEAGKMLQKCLPRNSEGEKIRGSVAFYTNKSGVIIESTDKNIFGVGEQFERISKICKKLSTGESHSEILEIEGVRYIIGSTKTKGYREYKGLEWSAHVLRPF